MYLPLVAKWRRSTASETPTGDRLIATTPVASICSDTPSATPQPSWRTSGRRNRTQPAIHAAWKSSRPEPLRTVQLMVTGQRGVASTPPATYHKKGNSVLACQSHLAKPRPWTSAPSKRARHCRPRAAT